VPSQDGAGQGASAGRYVRVRKIARRAQEGRDALCAPEDPSSLRAPSACVSGVSLAHAARARRLCVRVRSVQPASTVERIHQSRRSQRKRARERTDPVRQMAQIASHHLAGDFFNSIGQKRTDSDDRVGSASPSVSRHWLRRPAGPFRAITGSGQSIDHLSANARRCEDMSNTKDPVPLATQQH
jgi:hypothetical protein